MGAQGRRGERSGGSFTFGIHDGLELAQLLRSKVQRALRLGVGPPGEGEEGPNQPFLVPWGSLLSSFWRQDPWRCGIWSAFRAPRGALLCLTQKSSL